MTTKIIAAFPGTGKSHFASHAGHFKSVIDQISASWDRFLDFLESQNDCETIILSSGQYIDDSTLNVA